MGLLKIPYHRGAMVYMIVLPECIRPILYHTVSYHIILIRRSITTTVIILLIIVILKISMILISLRYK